MTEELSVILVFAAGLLSFLSPCVLPLIPSYLSILGGTGFTELKNNAGTPGYVKPRLLLPAAGFTLGFSAVFITLGILVSATFFLMGGILTLVNRAAGIIVIVLGLNVIFDFLPFLNYEKRPFLSKKNLIPKQPRLWGMPAGFVAGAAFGTGWTPCIGPILTSILFLAAQGGKTGAAVFYLSVYSAGLALPFLLAALFFDSFLKRRVWLQSRMLLIRRISGIILIIFGIMILSGQFTALNRLIQKLVLGYIDWAETAALPFRLLGRALGWIQGF